MYAKIIVDVSNNEVDRVFDYLAPDDIKRGQRVTVPFGNRNVEGYVISLSETTDLPPEKIKSVTEIISPQQVISEEMFRLADFMRGRYHLRMVDALRLFIPSQMRGGRVKELSRLYARVADEFADADKTEFISSRSFAQNELFDFLRQNGATEVSRITRDFSAAAYRNLLSRGILVAEERAVKREPYKNSVADGGAVRLTDEQTAAAERIKNGRGVFVLHGVTGSGKTEVYMNCISDALAKNKTAIMLVPEISLTPQIFSLFKNRFKDSVAILHSGLSAGERFDEWCRLLSGEAKIAVGARSAIFAPLKDLGLIIIDEEHDGSYNSESNPRYITHEVARFRSEYNSCNLVLGSATPSVETYYRAATGEYSLIEMKNRVNKTPPQIEVVNMCSEAAEGNNGVFSEKLLSELNACLKNGNQAMIFINRRGYSSFVRCSSCGYVAKCERCDVSLVYHRDEGETLKCHYCGNRYSMPTVCPKCGEAHLRRGYVGTQQVAEKITEFFPTARVLRMDNDTTRNKDAHLDILTKFRDRKADILVGTQMIAKGHDFPSVTLVGIIDADMSLHYSDFRSSERTFQLITQVAGRAGRADKHGKVVLQTYSPSHYVYKFAVSGNYKGFFDKELNLRQVTAFPPFSTLLRVLVTSESERDAANVLKSIYEKMLALSRNGKKNFAYLGYMYSPLKKIKDKSRMQVLARITDSFDEILSEVYNITDESQKRGVSVFVEINPNNLT